MEAVHARSGAASSSVCCGSALPFLPAAGKDTLKQGPTLLSNTFACVSSINASPSGKGLAS